jgi:hypothetical protein
VGKLGGICRRGFLPVKRFSDVILRYYGPIRNDSVGLKMRKYKDLGRLLSDDNGMLDKARFTDLLADDLNRACCSIYGETIDEVLVLLAELKIQPESIQHSSGLFQQNIEFVMVGEIINNQYPALTYRVDTGTFQFYGRCSTIPQICGVDLYLDKSYTEKVGDCVRQKFILPVNKLFKAVR